MIIRILKKEITSPVEHEVKRDVRMIDVSKEKAENYIEECGYKKIDECPKTFSDSSQFLREYSFIREEDGIKVNIKESVEISDEVLSEMVLTSVPVPYFYGSLVPNIEGAGWME